MTVDVGEDVDPACWAPLPSHDRLLAGGHTVWIRAPDVPASVTQPNRWGVVETDFPAVPCLVECDPEVIRELVHPAEVVGFVDRRHRPIDPSDFGSQGKELMDRAERLAKRLTQIGGVRILARPFARKVPLLTPREASRLIQDCAADGLIGLRPLGEVGGAVALTVSSRHTRSDFDAIAEIFGRHAGR